MRKETLGKTMFSLRSYTPIPFIIAAVIWSRVSWSTYLIGLAAVLAGEAVRLWAVSFAGPMTRMRNVGASMLITTGPFAYTRNPLYSGNFLLGCGFCIMSWAFMPWLVVLFIAAFFLQYRAIVAHEEAFLSEKFGTEFLEYRGRVPGLIPSLRPYSKQSGPEPSFLRGLKSERRTLQTVIILCVVFLVRLFV